MENFLFPSADDELRAENEIKKLRLELESGAQIGYLSNDIPPEVEKQWLDHIINYEETRKKAEECTVYELIGSPELRKSSDIPDEEIEDAYLQLLELLQSKGVLFEALTTYDESNRLFYTFITEQLFHHKTDNYFIPSGFQVYVYEEFVPNHLYDLKRRLNDLLEYIFDEKYPGGERFDNFVFDTPDLVSADESAARLESALFTEFLNKYPKRDVIMMTEPVFRFELIEPSEESTTSGSGTATFDITWTATDAEGRYVSFSDAGRVEFELNWGWWAIKKFAIPGLVIP